MSDSLIDQLRDLVAGLPPVETVERVNSIGDLEIKFADPEDLRLWGGTLVIPKGLLTAR